MKNFFASELKLDKTKLCLMRDPKLFTNRGKALCERILSFESDMLLVSSSHGCAKHLATGNVDK